MSDDLTKPTRERTKVVLDAMHPKQREFYLRPTPRRFHTPVVAKPTREIPPETLAFLKECCK